MEKSVALTKEETILVLEILKKSPGAISSPHARSLYVKLENLIKEYGEHNAKQV